MLSIGKAISESAATHSSTQRDLPAQRVARALGGLALACGATALMGWMFHIEALTRAIADGESMKPNTAFGFVLLGALLLAPKHAQRGDSPFRWRTTVAVLVLSIAVATGVQYVFSIDLGIDRLFVTQSHADLASTVRMSEISALSFTLLGSALLIIDSPAPRARTLAEALVLIVFGIGYIGTIGYVFEEEKLYRAGLAVALSIQGAILFALVSAALLLARPQQGIAYIVTRKDVRGMLLRRLLPTVLLLAPLAGWLQTRASQGPRPFDAVLVVLGSVMLLTVLVWWIARTIQTAVAARDHAEATRKASEERMQWALEAAGGGAWDWDFTHDKAWWSDEMYKLWDVDPDAHMTFKRSRQLIDARDREHVASALDRAIEGRCTYRCAFRITTRDGAERWMESRGRAAYDADGQAVRLLGISIDVTAQKKVELALRESNEALERSNMELQRFAYVASHDLQTPLRAVASFVELLQMRHGDALPAQANEWLCRIRSSVDKLHHLISDLLQYSRVESQARHFEFVSMDEILLRAMHLLDASIRETGATIERSSLPSVRGDATQLMGVLLNLVGNALKYHGAAPPHVTISASALPNAWLFCVADNGIGIEPRHFDRIFEMFERLHSAAEHPGTGIGLAICRSVIHRHGGRIWVESVPGNGSKFFFTIPRATSASSSE